jgi:glycosyltransferase involved in cell wall biosynthesis
MNKKLAIITTHPIQYYAPLFQLLAKRNKIDLHVFYTKGEEQQQYEPDFGKTIAWDIPLLEGYDFTFVPNAATDVGLHHFSGIKNPSLIQAIKDFGANAILVFGWSYESHLKTMWHFKGKIPVYFRGDSTLLDETGGIKAIMRRIFLILVYSQIDKAFYVGENNKAYYKKHLIKDQNLIFAPHAIDNKRFGLKFSVGNSKIEVQNTNDGVFNSKIGVQNSNDGAFNSEIEHYKQIFKIKSNEIVVLFVGKFEPKKNPVLLLNAFKELNLKNAHLIFVGNGVLENELKEKAKDTTHIHFLPFQNQSKLPQIYGLGDIFCLPSQGPGETWGLAVNEAMAGGNAVLVSDKCGCAINLVETNKNGFVFKSNDKEDLKAKLKALVASPELQNIKIAAFNTIQAYSFEKIVEAIENEIQKIV